jgi:hypothetical protein
MFDMERRLPFPPPNLIMFVLLHFNKLKAPSNSFGEEKELFRTLESRLSASPLLDQDGSASLTGSHDVDDMGEIFTISNAEDLWSKFRRLSISLNKKSTSISPRSNQKPMLTEDIKMPDQTARSRRFGHLNRWMQVKEKSGDERNSMDIVKRISSRKAWEEMPSSV